MKKLNITFCSFPDFSGNAKALYEKLKDTTDCTFISHDDDYHGLHTSKDSEDILEILKFLER